MYFEVEQSFTHLDSSVVQCACRFCLIGCVVSKEVKTGVPRDSSNNASRGRGLHYFCITPIITVG